MGYPCPHQQWLIWYILAIINENGHKSYVFTPARVTLCKHSQAQATIGILVKHSEMNITGTLPPLLLMAKS